MPTTKKIPPLIHEKVEELTERIKKLDAEKASLTQELLQLQRLLEEEKKDQGKAIPVFTPTEKI